MDHAPAAAGLAYRLKLQMQVLLFIITMITMITIITIVIIISTIIIIIIIIIVYATSVKSSFASERSLTLELDSFRLQPKQPVLSPKQCQSKT